MSAINGARCAVPVLLRNLDRSFCLAEQVNPKGFFFSVKQFGGIGWILDTFRMLPLPCLLPLPLREIKARRL